MSTAPAAVPQPRRSSPIVSPSPRATAPWAALAITSMWVAVLFVGLFGGDIISETPGGTSSRVPAAVAVALIALIATVFVARWGLRPDARAVELQTELDDERRQREALEVEINRLRDATAEPRA